MDLDRHWADLVLYNLLDEVEVLGDASRSDGRSEGSVQMITSVEVSVLLAIAGCVASVGGTIIC